MSRFVPTIARSAAIVLALGLGAPAFTAAQISVVSPEQLDLVLGEGEQVEREISYTFFPFCVVPFDLEVIGSSPDALVENLSGIQQNLCGGDTSTFNVRITGTGEPQQFDLIFVPVPNADELGRIAVRIETPISAAAPSSGEVGAVHACFYECAATGPGPWKEVTTLLLANTSGGARGARIALLDGNANPLAVVALDLAADDLDELHVCRTLARAGIEPPRAGLAYVLSDRDAEGLLAWVKNWAGVFFRALPEPSSGLVSGVGKTECRVVSPVVSTPAEVRARVIERGVPQIPALLVEGTDDR